MFCPHCGTQVVPVGTLFCQKCAKPVNAALIDGSPSDEIKATTPKGAPKPIGAFGWVLVALLAVMYSGVALTLYDGTSLGGDRLGQTAMFTGISLAYFRRRQGRSGWLGFGVGFVLAIALVYVGSISAGAIRGIMR